MGLADGMPSFGNRKSNGTSGTRGNANGFKLNSSGSGGGGANRGLFNSVFNQQPAADISGFTNAHDIFSDYGSPQGAILEAQGERLDGQIQLTGLNQQTQADALNQIYNSQMGQNQLSQQSIGVDQAAIPRQSQYYANLYGIDKEKYNNNMGYQGQLKGYSNRNYDSVIAKIQNNSNQTNYTADKNIRGLQSQATAMGSFTSSGAREGRYDINADRMFGLENINQNKTQAGIGHEKELAGITNTMNNLTSDFKAAGLTEQEQQARLQDRSSQLSIQAQQLGLKSGELSAQLQSGLSKLNLDTAINVGQLMDAITSNDLQQQQLAIQIMNQALGAGTFMGNVFGKKG